MGRIIAGGIMTGWSLVIIPANAGNAGYEIDLWFGFALLLSGVMLTRSGIQRARTADSARSHPETKGRTDELATDQPDGPGSGGSLSARVTESLVVSVVGGVVTGLLLNMLGISG